MFCGQAAEGFCRKNCVPLNYMYKKVEGWYPDVRHNFILAFLFYMLYVFCFLTIMIGMLKLLPLHFFCELLLFLVLVEGQFQGFFFFSASYYHVSQAEAIFLNFLFFELFLFLVLLKGYFQMVCNSHVSFFFFLCVHWLVKPFSVCFFTK